MYDRILKFFNDNDHFAKENGMVITRLGEGTSEAVLTASERHFNGMGIIMGGALFTLTDFAFAAALNSFGFRAVGMNASTSFLKPGKGVPGAKFTARAKLVSKTRRTAVFDVDVRDEQGRLLTHSIMTGFISETPLFND
jgi:acyl-CoA thioesterase